MEPVSTDCVGNEIYLSTTKIYIIDLVNVTAMLLQHLLTVIIRTANVQNALSVRDCVCIGLSIVTAHALYVQLKHVTKAVRVKHLLNFNTICSVFYINFYQI